MNLAWLAAVLQPYDVASHPNIPDAEYDDRPVAQLAAIIIGGPWNRRVLARPDAPASPNSSLELAERCLEADSIAAGVPALALRLLTEPPADPAEAAALTLIAASAAAELEDYDTSLELLNRQIARLTDHPEGAVQLVAAALFQQKALRLSDMGRPDHDLCFSVGNFLRGFESRLCEPFTTNRGVAWDWSTTAEQMRLSLLDAAASLVPWTARARPSGRDCRQTSSASGTCPRCLTSVLPVSVRSSMRVTSKASLRSAFRVVPRLLAKLANRISSIAFFSSSWWATDGFIPNDGS